MRTEKLIFVALVLLALPPLGTIFGAALLVTMATRGTQEVADWAFGPKEER